MSKRNVVIYVAGQRFSLCTEDSDEYVIEVGEKVDVMIKGIQKDNPRLNRDACATLAALSICDDETKLRRKVETLREQIKEYLKDSEALRKENEALKAKLDSLEKKPAANTDSMQKPSQEDKKPAVEENHRYTAFVGRDFRSENKKPENHQSFVKQKSFEQQKPAPKQPAPFYKKQQAEKPAPAALADDKGLSGEPPLQYSIFDTDFI